MTMQIQQHYTGVNVSPEESWNVNLLTILSKLVMAFVMFAVVMIISMMG